MPPCSAPPRPCPAELPFVYEYDWDDRGLLYYLGTHTRTGVPCRYRNPISRENAVVIYKSIGDATSGRSKERIANRLLSRRRCSGDTSGGDGQGLGVRMVDWECHPTAYTLATWFHPALPKEHGAWYHVRKWKFQGLKDGMWSTISMHSSQILRQQNDSYTWKVTAPLGCFYKAFRIKMNGSNSVNVRPGYTNDVLCLGGIEIYGHARRLRRTGQATVA